MIAVGIANSRGHGVATTTTARKRCTSLLRSPAIPARISANAFLMMIARRAANANVRKTDAYRNYLPRRRADRFLPDADLERQEVLRLSASLEHYSKHPLAGAIIGEAHKHKMKLLGVTELSEPPGQGLQGTVEGRTVRITGRKQADEMGAVLPEVSSGLECVVFVGGRYAATMRFHDAPRRDSRLFIQHLKPRHGVRKVMLVSGDRKSEVQYLAHSVGISEVRAGKSPEEKVDIVKEETAKAKTLFVGDGINDAPALTAATVGVAFGSQSDIITEAADAVILETSLGKIDELLHIGRRMRRIALQSALGGISASIVGMIAAAMGYLPPIGGAIAQEIIDLFAVLNAVRVTLPMDDLQDF